MFKLAIVGRPNVGKSTLFNRLTRSRRALVGDEPGITRDRITAEAVWDGRRFEVIDTGGMIPESREVLPELILSQAEAAVEEADLILFVVDARSGLLPIDQELNALLKAKGKACFLVVNKVDVPGVENEVFQFFELGVDAVFPVSAEHNLGIEDLVSAVADRIPEVPETEAVSVISVAIIGRPNVGKSSLLNRLLGKDRVIVSEIPGTTRDAVDTLLEFQGQGFRLVDTAGIRRKGKTQLRAEKLSVVMARKNIARADIVLLIIDGVEGATALDATIGGYAHDAGKSVIIVVNKWDQVEKDTHTAVRLENDFRTRMRFLYYAPLVFVSAHTGQRVVRLLELARDAFQARTIRVPTGELNQFLNRQVGPLLASGSTTRKFPLKYATQVSVSPPTFVLFLRGSARLHFSTVRFIINQLRKQYGFYATPIRILQRAADKGRRV